MQTNCANCPQHGMSLGKLENILYFCTRITLQGRVKIPTGGKVREPSQGHESLKLRYRQ